MFKQRTKLLSEIVTSEKSYLADLGLLVGQLEFFRKAYQGRDVKEGYWNFPEIEEIIGAYDKLKKQHEKLLTVFETEPMGLDALLGKVDEIETSLKEFIQFYLKQAPKLVAEVKYVPLPDAAYKLASDNFAKRKLGTGFGGEAEVGVLIEELLKREGKH